MAEQCRYLTVVSHYGIHEENVPAIIRSLLLNQRYGVCKDTLSCVIDAVRAFDVGLVPLTGTATNPLIAELILDAIRSRPPREVAPLLCDFLSPKGSGGDWLLYTVTLRDFESPTGQRLRQQLMGVCTLVQSSSIYQQMSVLMAVMTLCKATKGNGDELPLRLLHRLLVRHVGRPIAGKMHRDDAITATKVADGVDSLLTFLDDLLDVADVDDVRSMVLQVMCLSAMSISAAPKASLIRLWDHTKRLERLLDARGALDAKL